MSLDALALGATLYVPATRGDLEPALLGGRIPDLRSAVICLEDAVLDADLPQALANLARFLRRLPVGAAGPPLFVRPRDPAMLKRILHMPGAERLAGFVFPKVTAETLPAWVTLPLASGQRLMPTLETREVFDPNEMRRLRDQLLAIGPRVLAVRIGGNDLLSCLGLRRSAHRTCYDGPLGPFIAALAGCFLPYGIALSAPVMERFGDLHLLGEEVARDIEHGLLTKTAVHPSQVPVIQAALAVPSAELAEARAILAQDAPAVFARAGAMCEPATHRHWAERLVRRADLFGVVDEHPRARGPTRISLSAAG
jgi:citrate lyase beta subunit